MQHFPSAHSAARAVCVAAASLTFLGACSARVDDEPPLPSSWIVRTKTDVRPPFATPVSALPRAIAPATPPPLPPAVASALAAVPWDRLDRFKLGSQTPKDDVSLSLLPPLVMGAPYAAADVSAAVEAFALNYKTCFLGVATKPEEAQVNAHFSVSASGKPLEIEMTSTLSGEAKDGLLGCVKPWLQRIELPPPNGGQPTVAVQMRLGRKTAKLAGVPLGSLTLDVLKGALQTLGCRRVVDNEGQLPTTVKAVCPRDGGASGAFDPASADVLTIVFVPAREAETSPDLPGAALRKKLLEEGAVLEGGGTFLGVTATPEALAAPAWLERLTILPEAQRFRRNL